MQGPFAIFCRGHSGGRIVCEAYQRNGIQMGNVTERQKDTPFFAIHKNEHIREIILNSYKYFSADASTRQRLQTLMRKTVDEFRRAEIQGEGAFGWKNGHNIFTAPILLDALPEAKVVHVIRDGRDVMLSRLDVRVARLDDPANRLMVFGDAEVAAFADLSLNAETIEKFRNELEMQHWVTAVEYGLRCRTYKGRYLEIKYEDVCIEPIKTFGRIFDFLGVPFLDETMQWLRHSTSTSRIGKWKALPPEALEQPLKIGGPLLSRLAYL